MAEARVNRKLAAILAADVVGYSRLMGVDEEGTLAALKQHRQAVFDPAVAAHNGRIVKLIGDGTIVEFGSVVDAVHCALAVQRSNGALPDEAMHQPNIVLRIGINLGDVIIEGDDIYGDGVNIAARLEPLAEPGGICVSSIVNESIGNRIDVRFQDAGDISVKNIDRPIRVWKWHPSATPDLSKPGAEKPLPNVATASIAILPFTNMSGDPEQEYFSDGISEDIITDLSKIAGLTVIARNSSFTYKGRSIDIRTVGRELGVQSVLEGSIRRAGNRVRITAQLIDATNGAHLWADRYDRDLTDIFAVQDDVTQRIVEALKITLTPAEKERLADSETSSVIAYDCVLRGREFMLGKEKNLGTFKQAVKYFKEALEHDPNYSVAHACLGFGYMFDYQNRWTEDPDKSLLIAKDYARQAIEKDPNEPLARCVSALAASYEKDLDRAKVEIDAALTLNPSLALAHNLRGTIRTFSGEPLDAIPEIEQAMRLDPALSGQFLHFLGLAYLMAEKYETAAALLRQRIILVPNTDFSRAILTSALGHLGEIEEARRVWAELMDINPNYSFAGHIGRQPFKRKEDVERIAEGLRKAGVLS
ncbi:MAG: adenylate/guanylate cyclase domain-containing protein [Xanthobacteraceae bacterium]